MQTVQ